MQTWAKRGLQTALVTGGLLMLGTGIASADENPVSPDTPASPLDLNVTVPVQTANNAIGTPFGQADVPAMNTELSTKPVTEPLKGGAQMLDKGSSPVSQSTLGGATKADGAGAFTPTDSTLKHNKVVGDVVVPIQIVDNAVAVLGDAKVEGGNHQQTWTHNQDVDTTGEGSGLAGNVVNLDWAAPVQLAGNGVGLAGGSGRVNGGSASQSATETGNTTTNGNDASASGNVVGGQLATPVQVTGNAASWILGNAHSEGYNADTSATSGGWIKTAGDEGAASGNVGAVPVALPVKFNDNAASAWGSNAHANSNSTADAKAGDKTPGFKDTPAYVQTTGQNSFADGTVLAPQTADVANVSNVAATWIGNAATGKPGAMERQASGNTTGSNVDAGGFVQSTGDGAAGSANVVDPALAAPVEVTCIGGSHIGNANAAGCVNDVTANAGNGSHTTGDNSTLTGNVVNTQDALAPEVYGVGGSFIGQGTASATETKNVTAGAYDGTTGNDSSGSGNIVQVPTAVPTEVLGTGGSFIGQGSGTAQETKTVSGGGGGNTNDDNGFLSSNLATTPVSLPVQAFGVGGTFIGQGHGKASGDTTSNAGGDVHATGDKGAGAGNLVHVPVSEPTQVHGIGGALAGIGTGASDNLTDSKAGGKATADGKDGALAGNIVQGPIGGSVPVAGHGVGAAGIGRGVSTNDVMSAAGGDSATNGDGGAASGNIIGAEALPVVPAANDAVSGAGGIAHGTGTDTTNSTSGGNLSTSGVEGSLSGDILDIPAAADPKAFGDAVAAVGSVSKAQADNQTIGQVGGDAVTDGDSSSLSGVNLHHPLVLIVPADALEVPVLANADSDTKDVTSINGEDSSLPLDLPKGSELSATTLPALPATGLPGLPGAAQTMPAAERADSPVKTTPVQLAGLESIQNQLTGLGNVGSKLGNLGHLGGGVTPKLPTPAQRADEAPGLPSAPAVPAAPALPATPALPGAPELHTAKLPSLANAQFTPKTETPALATADSSPLSMFRDLLAKLTGKFHTMGK
ncbi:beta strand repeat-containing protein [Amycolatopsis sp. NPDC059027]|uniref:beta strand repeat-containing protein n=1 Tax=Amycolatopsis sp. NPDC059027 TaxID=3346709 RepID=UPI0036727973